MVRGGGGNGNMAAIKGGKALAWGSNASGITGQNTTSGTTSSPTVLSGFSSDTDWTDISTSGGHSGGIRDSGKLYTWGNNTLYRTGLGTNVGSTNVATRVGSDTDWLRISTQLANCSVATKTTFQLWSWGDNTSGRTGQGTSSGTTNAPTRVGTDSDWKKLIVVAGNAATHGVAI
jgi:alpha-tubulin suppressor-like RCC1 family protein